MSKTIKAQTPKPPAWVRRAGAKAVRAWNSNLGWRANAASATTPQYRRALIAEAKHMYR